MLRRQSLFVFNKFASRSVEEGNEDIKNSLKEAGYMEPSLS